MNLTGLGLFMVIQGPRLMPFCGSRAISSSVFSQQREKGGREGYTPVLLKGSAWKQHTSLPLTVLWRDLAITHCKGVWEM